MTILSVNTFSSLPPALGDAGSNTTAPGNNHQAPRSSEAFGLFDWLSAHANAGGAVGSVLDQVLNPQPGPLEQAASELKKSGGPSLLESLGGAHPIAHQGVSERRSND